jgi:hypothetical protein
MLALRNIGVSASAMYMKQKVYSVLSNAGKLEVGELKYNTKIRIGECRKDQYLPRHTIISVTA